MSKFLNKLSNSITNNASIVIGRENLNKISNSINRAIWTSKYREDMKPGNIVQLISKNSHLAVQICASINDPNRLIVLGNGQIGPDHRNAHFNVIKVKSNSHFKFQNGPNFLSLDEPGGIPCILSEPTHPKPKPHEFIRARNEFRLHEIIGSDEWFALESVYFPGRYLSIMPDGAITITKNKDDVSCHFGVHLITEHPSNVKPGSSTRQSLQPSASNSSMAGAAAASAVGDRVSISSGQSSNSYQGYNSMQSEESRRKQEESERYAREQRELNQQPASSSYSTPSAPPTANNEPPTYGNLFPTLPPSQ